MNQYFFLQFKAGHLQMFRNTLFTDIAVEPIQHPVIGIQLLFFQEIILVHILQNNADQVTAKINEPNRR